VFARYSTVGFGPVDPSVYRFVPPQGATVKRLHALVGPMPAAGPLAELGEYAGAPGGVHTFGSGWATVVAVKVPSDLMTSADGGSAASLPRLGMLSGSLFSIRLVPRGDHAWLVYGAVPQAAILAVEDRLP
jgi:hypothetical protein